MGPTMNIEHTALFLENVDDGTGSNPQRGYFAIDNMVGPFTSEKDALDYLESQTE